MQQRKHKQFLIFFFWLNDLCLRNQPLLWPVETLLIHLPYSICVVIIPGRTKKVHFSRWTSIALYVLRNRIWDLKNVNEIYSYSVYSYQTSLITASHEPACLWRSCVSLLILTHVKIAGGSAYFKVSYFCIHEGFIIKSLSKQDREVLIK